MSVSFFAHRQELLNAYNDVLNDQSSTDWSLFSYEGNQNELKVEAKGEDGLEELESEFNSGKIMYAFVRIIDPNTALKKFILIVWQGEGVPATKKGACANHVKDVARFFKGTHVTLYARNEDDVSPEEIMRQIKKSTSNFTFVSPKEDHSSQQIVGSVYKRINPKQEIQSTRNEAFWEKVQREEEQRKKEEKRKEMEKRKKDAMELKEEEARSQANRNHLVKEREREINEKMRAQKLADNQAEIRAQEKEKFEKQEKEQMEALQELRSARRTQSIEHTQEAESLISKRSNNPRAVWAEREKGASTLPVRKFSSSETQSQSTSEQPSSYKTSSNMSSNFRPEPEPLIHRNNLQSNQSEFQQTQQSNQSDDISYEQEEVAQQVYEQSYDSQGAHTEVDDTQSNTVVGVSLQAHAIYDYQAEDDSEISFDPGDLITDIEQIDEGWWRGVAPDGSYGLFPANYVELI